MPFSSGIQPPCIWVDADSCPAPARAALLQSASRRYLAVTYVANRQIPFTLQSDRFHMVVCSPEPGAADNYIAGHCTQNDIVITRDLPLAKRLLDKGITVINDRGIQFDEDTLIKMMEERELSLQMAALGVLPKARPRAYGKKETRSFADCLARVLDQKQGRLFPRPPS